MRGSIVWRCRKCGKNKATGSCDHPGAKYYVVCMVGNIQKWEPVGRNKKDAERRLNEVVAGLQQGTYHLPKKILFKDFSEEWLTNNEGTVKPTTLQYYRTLVRTHLIPAFGGLFLGQISPAFIEAFRGRCGREKGLSPKTTNSLLTTLKTMLNYARFHGYIQQNPAERVKRVRVDQKEMEYLEPKEIRLLLDNSDEPYRTLFFTAILTGMRIGELLGFQWGDIDWNASVIYVRRTLYYRSMKGYVENSEEGKKSWEFSTPKSRKSIRAVKVSPRLREALELHRLACPLSQYDLVFCTSKGTPINPRNIVRREFRPALTRAGIRKIRFHDLRHTYTTLLIAQGENVKFIQSQLGHASIQTTLDRYGHLLPDAGKDIGERLDALVFGGGDKSRANGVLMEQPKTPPHEKEQA